jgi:hypothetical protein
MHHECTDEQLIQTVEAYKRLGTQEATASELDLARSTIQNRLRKAAKRGFLLDHPPAMPGFQISQVTTTPNGGKFIQQELEPGEEFKVRDGLKITGETAFVDEENKTLRKWILTREDKHRTLEIIREAVAAFTTELPRADPVIVPGPSNDDLLNQYTVTDLHFGMLSWKEETGADYDLKLAEQLLLDWFTSAIRMSPDASTAVLAQLGDLLHHDSHLSVTPTHANVLDADSRLQKIIRTVIRTLRRIIKMLLEKHQKVHLIMADANHDPASGAWLREMFAAFFENEPRITVDSTASTYYMLEHGETSLFYHHGHKRKLEDVDTVFAGKFREAYGRTKYSYAHIGHKHSDQLKSTNLMKVEQHETLAAPDAYTANGGWLAPRSAKVITYSKRFGEVSRITIRPEMVMK